MIPQHRRTFGALMMRFARFTVAARVIAIIKAMMGLPPVVCRARRSTGCVAWGPLGPLGLLFTPPAMVIAQDDPHRAESRSAIATKSSGRVVGISPKQANDLLAPETAHGR